MPIGEGMRGETNGWCGFGPEGFDRVRGFGSPIKGELTVQVWGDRRDRRVICRRKPSRTGLARVDGDLRLLVGEPVALAGVKRGVAGHATGLGQS